ncbi:MAG: hypothetical protein ACI9XB_002842 [Gammaproteobacteria bacterium]|jgi:hypothetical protein
MSAGLFAQICIEKIYLGGGAGFTKLTGDIGEDGSGGLTYFVDGAVYLTPQLAVGGEGNFNLHGYKNGFYELKIRNANLFLAKAEYYFIDNSFSPFAGLGLGLSNIVRPEVLIVDSAGNESVLVGKDNRINLAVSPRVGFVAGGFLMEFIYNFAGKEPSVEGLETFTYNFWTLSLGYRYIFEL